MTTKRLAMMPPRRTMTTWRRSTRATSLRAVAAPEARSSTGPRLPRTSPPTRRTRRMTRTSRPRAKRRTTRWTRIKYVSSSHRDCRSEGGPCVAFTASWFYRRLSGHPRSPVFHSSGLV